MRCLHFANISCDSFIHFGVHIHVKEILRIKAVRLRYTCIVENLHKFSDLCHRKHCSSSCYRPDILFYNAVHVSQLQTGVPRERNAPFNDTLQFALVRSVELMAVQDPYIFSDLVF